MNCYHNIRSLSLSKCFILKRAALNLVPILGIVFFRNTSLSVSSEIKPSLS